MADSNTHNKKLHYLKDLAEYKVAKDEPDVRGWEIHDSTHQSVGKISGLIVDVAREKVRYLDVEVDSNIIPGDHDPFGAEHKDGIHEYQDSKGAIHMIVPIGVAHIDTDRKVVIADGIDQNVLRNIPTYRYQENTPVHSEYEERVLANFRNKNKPVGGTGTTDQTASDDIYNSEHFNEDRFYGRDRK